VFPGTALATAQKRRTSAIIKNITSPRNASIDPSRRVGAGLGTGDGAGATAVEGLRSWLIKSRLVKPEHEPSHPADTPSGSPRGSVWGLLQAFILGCISCSGQPEAGRRPLCDQELTSLDRRSRQRGDDAEESLTVKVYVAENPVNVHDLHLSSGNPSHGPSSSGRRTVRRGTIAEA